jgi:hypothetical protein
MLVSYFSFTQSHPKLRHFILLGRAFIFPVHVVCYQPSYHCCSHLAIRLNLVATNQYSETNVMHFPFSLRINDLYIVSSVTCSSLGDAAQSPLGICVRVTSVGCTGVQPTDITRTQYTKCRLFSSS